VVHKDDFREQFSSAVILGP